MFEKFTDEARRVVVLAQEESRRLGHSYIGTEHLLLGVLRVPGSTAAQILESMEVTLSDARGRVEEIIGRGSEDKAATGHIPFTPRAKRVLEMSLRESMELGQRHIDTEHLLLAILREGEGVAAQILTGLDIGTERVRQQVSVRQGQQLADDPTFAARQEAAHADPRTDPPDVRDRLDVIEARVAEIIERLGAIERRLDQAS